jgi:hypothetical protein
MYAHRVKWWWTIGLPLVGTLVAAAVPLVRYARMQRDEGVAIDVMARVQGAQAAFQRLTGGFATDAASLTRACEGSEPVLAPDVLSGLTAAGYGLLLRAAEGAIIGGRDCLGRDLASDYYAAVAPLSPETVARQAFASRGDGRIYLFVDGLAPRERDMASGLATPLEARDSFKIP